MQCIETDIEGVYILEPQVFEDARGYFFESYNKALLASKGIRCDFVQDNQSMSKYGVIRGLHYQLHPHAQQKLIRVIEGRILDVIVDIRKGSPQYGKTMSIELSNENQKQLLIPAGFAHGFSVLSEKAIVVYKCDAYYHRESEAGIRFDDPELGIDWQVPPDKIVISEKDRQLPTLAACQNNFEYSS